LFNNHSVCHIEPIAYWSGINMRYPLVAGICLLICMTAFAAPKVAQTAPSAASQEVSENESVPQQNIPTVSTETINAPVSLPETEQKSEIINVAEETAPRQHRVHKVWLWQESRDCLWNIAKKYYNDPWQWKKIYLANKYQIDDPRQIFPRQILIIPPLEEQEKNK
jgi:nucleoid-associated protein YgaU